MRTCNHGVQKAEITTESIANTARAAIFKKQVFKCLLVIGYCLQKQFNENKNNKLDEFVNP